MPLRIPLFALTIIALALAGCGDSAKTTGGGDDAAEPAPLTRTELIAKADAICKDMQKKLDAVPAPESMDELATAIGKQIDLSGPAIKKLQALAPPEDLASTYDSWTAKLAQMQAGTERIRAAAASGSQTEVQKIVDEVDAVNKQADRLGRQIGFKACAK